MKAMLTIVFAALAFAGPAVAGKPISFQKIPAGDTIEVTFMSVGCFHRVSYKMTFAPGENAVVSIKDLYSPKPGKHLGKIAVSGRDLAGLDRLMKYYRTPHLGGCTTVDQIKLVQKHDGKVVAEEEYTDSTCGTYDKKDFTLFPALAGRLEKKP